MVCLDSPLAHVWFGKPALTLGKLHEYADRSELTVVRDRCYAAATSTRRFGPTYGSRSRFLARSILDRPPFPRPLARSEVAPVPEDPTAFGTITRGPNASQPAGPARPARRSNGGALVSED